MKTLKNITSLIVLLSLPFLGALGLPAGDDTVANDEVRTIEITGTDRMQFDVTSITATPGETIRIVYTTKSNIPKAAMAHNVVFLKPETDLDAFVNASAMARDNQYIAPDYEDQVIAATDLAGGGETVEVTFTVPEETGEYEYICSFPGHYSAGMKGMLTVKQPNTE